MQRKSVLRELSLLLTVAAMTMHSSAETATGRVVKVGVLLADGFSQPVAKDNGTVGTPPPETAANWRGFIPEVVLKLGGQLGFVPTFHIVPDANYGWYSERTWSSVRTQLQSGDADFIAAPLTVTALREGHADFTHEVLDFGLSLVMKRPERLEPNGRGYAFFLGVFDSGIWGSAVAAFLVTTFLLHLNDRYNPRETQAKLSEHFTANTASASPLRQFTLLGSAFYVLSTGCFQGYQRAPRSLCGRCLSLFWWVFACLFVSTYTAGFLCSLVASHSSRDNPFAYMDARDQYYTDPESLLNITPVWVPGSNTDALMLNSTEPLLQFFYKRYIEASKLDTDILDRATNTNALVELVKANPRYLGILESPMADYHAMNSKCELVVAGALLTDRAYAFAFKENTNDSLFGDINAGILRLRETGFMREAYQKHFGGPHVPCRQTSSSAASVAFGLAGEELARMFRDSLPISLKTFAGPVVMFFLSLLLSAGAALADVHIYTNLEKHMHGAHVLRNTQEAQEEPAVGFSAERRQQPEGQQPQRNSPQPERSNVEI